MNKYIDPIIWHLLNPPPFHWTDWVLLAAFIVVVIAYLYILHTNDVAEREWKRRKNERRNLDGDPDELTNELRRGGLL